MPLAFAFAFRNLRSLPEPYVSGVYFFVARIGSRSFVASLKKQSCLSVAPMEEAIATLSDATLESVVGGYEDIRSIFASQHEVPYARNPIIIPVGVLDPVTDKSATATVD